MRGQWKITGFNTDMKKCNLFNKEQFIVNFTKDYKGATLSIGSEVDQKQYTIPLDWLLNELKKGGHL